MTLVQDIRPTGIYSPYVVDEPFDKAKKTLEDAGCKIITYEQNAGLRVQQGPEALVSREGNYVAEGGLHMPDGRVLLLHSEYNPIMLSPMEATNANRNEEDFYPTSEQIEWALSGAYVDLRKGKNYIPAEAFMDDDRTVFMFGENTEAYADFLKENDVRGINIYLANSQDSIFVRQGWFGGFGGRWGVDVGGGDLVRGGRVRGYKDLGSKVA